MLSSNSPDAAVSSEKVQKIVVLDKILLADYLKRPNLVMQINDNQLYYSDVDLWAESLQEDIHNTLLAWLNENAKNTRFISYDSPQVSNDLERVMISIRRFMPSDKGDVITNGQYWIINNVNGDNLTSQHSFSFTSELSQEGYSHSVSLLAEQLSQLSIQIANDIK
jgi:uncharacterized lipoprotein YmbA